MLIIIQKKDRNGKKIHINFIYYCFVQIMHLSIVFYLFIVGVRLRKFENVSFLRDFLFYWLHLFDFFWFRFHFTNCRYFGQIYTLRPIWLTYGDFKYWIKTLEIVAINSIIQSHCVLSFGHIFNITFFVLLFQIKTNFRLINVQPLFSFT